VDRNNQEIHDALLTYMQTAGASITTENMKKYAISEKDVEGCKKFYGLYVQKVI